MEPRGKAERALVVETAAGDRSVYPVGRSPGQGAGSGGLTSDSGEIPEILSNRLFPICSGNAPISTGACPGRVESKTVLIL
eukprot:7391937-Prymnesium_polylepis.2